MRKIDFHQNRNIIHKKLRDARIAKKLSQEELAAQMQLMNVNIDQQMISKIENNKRIVTDYELVCFSRILEVEPEELLSDFDIFVEK
ncbi:MAG: helix-turn-helix transcriptional regulator [Anaerotignum sp.]|jgi:transcriptional regulator with XRE-family HTH domain|nr:helix-turn-helix transcriptional regulator [Anaerotignum sp.]